MSDNPADLDFAKDEDSAAARAELFADADPFDKVIHPALLNSADIYDYIRVTSMVWPFDTKEEKLREKLKGASYEVDFLGDVYWFPGNAKELRQQSIKRNTVFTLEKNSIAFVFLEAIFRLPHYIAVRFNLRITHVHKGLLLGTGPLVDPGFRGRLLIPLHNLTSKDYTLIGGEGLIWVEFTKLSPYIENSEDIRRSKRQLFRIQPRKIDLDAQGYFNKASDGVPARSSIPGEVREAKQIAEKTSEKVDKYTWGAILVGGLTVLGLVAATWSLISDANKNVGDFSTKMPELRKSMDDLRSEVEKLQSKMSDLENRLQSTKSKSSEVRKK